MTQPNSLKIAKRSRKQFLSKVTHLERARDQPPLTSSAEASASLASSNMSAKTLSSLDWREFNIYH
jgi:hypothetical protein